MQGRGRCWLDLLTIAAMGAVEEPLLLPRHRIAVDGHDRMAAAGVLPPDARVERIEAGIIGRALPGLTVDLSGLLH